MRNQLGLLRDPMRRLLQLFSAVAVGMVLTRREGVVSEVNAQSEPQLTISQPRTNRWTQLRLSGESNVVWKLEASRDLFNWTTIATLHALDFVPFWTNPTVLNFQDVSAPDFLQRFYRASAVPWVSSDDWKNQIYFPSDPFAAAGQPDPESVRWVKFAILTNEPARVYYQDSRKYLFHYDFAVARLEPLKGLSRQDFDRVALHSNGQQVILGAVLLPPVSSAFPGAANVAEFGVQVVGQDPYPREQVVWWLDLIRSTVAAAPDVRAIYMPAFEQTPVARANVDFFLARGIEVDTPARWLSGDISYADGWTLGQLKYFPADQIDAAYADGRLTTQDILVTDTVPAEIPVVAGIITLGPSTPNSHVAIMARSYGIPFVYLAHAEDRERVLSLVGREALLQAVSASGRSFVEAFAVDPSLDESLRAELVSLKALPPLNFPAKEHYGAIAASVDNLTPSDIKYFGGKAAHFGLLRRAIPSNSPPAIAFSFDLWDAFMDQVLPSGATLREEIRNRLSHHQYPPDMIALKADLAAIRQIITKTASFSPTQKEAIIAALSGFDSGGNIRFRSSSNVEDGETFTGAGLYDSYSGCLLDDLDGDSIGPSHCDPTESEERGVFRAMQKVYASFYNDNAVLERLRRGVDEDKVGMALLVHHSFPDEIELANGVATYLRSGGVRRVEMVTQAGAVSVTNPDSSAQPEVVDESLVVRHGSSLVQLGDTVMSWPSEYSALLGLLDGVAGGYQQFYPGKISFLLDFEYKKAQPGLLEVKQVRPLPLPNTNQSITPFLLNDPVEYCMFQSGDAFPLHWAKIRLTLSTLNMRLNETNFAAGFYADGRLEFLQGNEIKILQGPLSSWSNAFYATYKWPQSRIFTNRWSIGDGFGRRDYELESVITYSSVSAQAPVLTLRELSPTGLDVLTLRVGYAAPQLAIDSSGNLTSSTNATLYLWPCSADKQSGVRQERTFAAGPVQIRSVFYWRLPRVCGGCTFPLIRWEETRINGLLPQPIVLRGHYSQTYGAGRHNWSEEFIFEPRLEPGLSAEQLSELQQANVQLIYVYRGYQGDPTRIFILGLDGQVRKVE